VDASGYLEVRKKRENGFSSSIEEPRAERARVEEWF